MKLSDHFTIEEATFSEWAIRNGVANEPSPVDLERMKTAADGMEIVRSLLGNKTISVSSWFRNGAVNDAIGGANTSDHKVGYAVDFRCPSYGSPFEIATFLATKKSVLNYDQLIHEYGRWVHISFSPKQRKQDLSVFTPGNYVPGITER